MKVLKVEEAAVPAPSMIENRVKEIADLYGCTVNELLTYISTDRQVNYYKNYAPKG